MTKYQVAIFYDNIHPKNQAELSTFASQNTVLKLLLPFFIILTIAFRPLMPFLDYAVNYRIIVEQKCENRAKPELGCNGKCYLSKEFAKIVDHAPKQNSASGNIFAGLGDIFLVADLFGVEFPNFTTKENQTPNHFHVSLYYYSGNENIFHPPLV